MALHDINGELNSIDRAAQLNSSSTWINPVKDGNSNSIPQIMIGRQTDGWGTGLDYGIKVAKPGYDVRTAEDSQLIFSSAYNTLKVVASGTISVNKPAGNPIGTATLTHNLGFRPLGSVMFTDTDSNNYVVPYTTWDTTTGAMTGFWWWRNETDNQSSFNVNLSTGNALVASDITYTFKYYLYVETAGA